MSETRAATPPAAMAAAPQVFTLLPEELCFPLGLESNVPPAEALAVAEARIKDALEKQHQLPDRHPAQPRLKKDRLKLEPIVDELREMVHGLKVDELCDLADAALAERPIKRGPARDFLKRAKWEGKNLAAESVYLRRVRELENRVDRDVSSTVPPVPAPAPAPVKPIPAPVANIPAPDPKTKPSTPTPALAPAPTPPPPPKVVSPPPVPLPATENPFLKLERLIDQGMNCFLNTPADLTLAEKYHADAEREAAEKPLPENLKNRKLFFKTTLERYKQDVVRSQIDRILKEIHELRLTPASDLSQIRERLGTARNLMRAVSDADLEAQLDGLGREISEIEQSGVAPAEHPLSKKLKVQLATRVLFRCQHMNKETQREVRATDFIIGRGPQGADATLDLSGDLRVSRRHARVLSDGGFFWIEDVASKFGTRLDGVEIKGSGRRRLNPLSRIQVGDTTLILMEDDTARVPFAPLAAKEVAKPNPVKIDSSLDAAAPVGRSAKGESPESLLQRQSWLLELHLELAAQRSLSELFPLILNRAVDAIPGAERGAVLLRGKDADSLLLAAYVSDGDPPVSDTLARKAMQDGVAFMWRRPMEQASAESVRRLNIESGIYAPMIREGRALGVICVDNPRRDSAFKQEDLRLMQALAHYAGMAVSNQQMQDELRENAVLLERLLTNFSPRLRNRIVSKAREGRLRPGGERSEVTILFADMRRFAIATANRDADEVMELLNDYLPALAQVVFKYEGTIDKFTGDGLLAVFGSPETDSEQHRHALMAAWEMQAVSKTITERRAKAGAITCELGVGLNSGLVLHGFLGSAEMLEFTVIGEVVNRANRFCSGAAPGTILLSPEIYQHVFQFIRAEPVSIETKNEGKFNAYRLVELKQPLAVHP